MIIHAPIENKVVSADDLHEARVIIYESVDVVSPDLKSTTPTLGSSTPKVPTRGEISAYGAFDSRNLKMLF